MTCHRQICRWWCAVPALQCCVSILTPPSTNGCKMLYYTLLYFANSPSTQYLHLTLDSALTHSIKACCSSPARHPATALNTTPPCCPHKLLTSPSGAGILHGRSLPTDAEGPRRLTRKAGQLCHGKAVLRGVLHEAQRAQQPGVAPRKLPKAQLGHLSPPQSLLEACDDRAGICL